MPSQDFRVLTTVQVLGARFTIKPMSNPNPRGDVDSCEQGDQTTKSYISLDLDKGTSGYWYKGFPPASNASPGPLAVNVEYNKPERIYVMAEARPGYYKWTLSPHLQVGAKEYWEPVNNGGKGFVTAPQGSYTQYAFDGGQRAKI